MFKLEFIFGLIVALLIAALMATGLSAYKWKQIADYRGWQAETAYAKILTLEKQLAEDKVALKAKDAYDFLATPVMKDLNMAQAIGALVEQAVTRAQAAGK